MPALIAGALTFLGVSGSIFGVSVALIGGYVITTAALIGLQLLLSPGAPNLPTPESGRQAKRQSTPPRCGIYGYRRWAGSFMLWHQKGPVAYMVHALMHGKMTSIERYYLNDDVVTLDVSGNVQALSDESYGGDLLNIQSRLGAASETAYASVVSALSGDDVWTDDHKGNGIASAALTCNAGDREDFTKHYPYQLPAASFGIKGYAVYDPRDVLQSRADPTTWAWSDNLVLQAIDYATKPIIDGGMGYDWEECFQPVLDDIIAEANVCDEAIPLKEGGTQKRYKGGGVFEFNNHPSDVLGSILAAGDIFWSERGDGAITLRAGKYRASDNDCVITDKHIISLKIQRYREDEDDTTGVVVRYCSIPHEFATVDAPVWPRDALNSDARRIRNLDVLWCDDPFQAQRLSKRVYFYETAKIRGTIVATMYGNTAFDRPWATLQTSDDPDLANAIIKLTRVEPDLVNAMVQIDFIVVNPNALDAWDPATEEGEPQPVVQNPRDGGAPTPAFVSASVQAFVVSNGQTGAVLSIKWDYPDRDDLGYIIRWRLNDADPGTAGAQPGPWVEERHDEKLTPVSGRLSVTTGIVPANSIIEVEMQSITTRGVRSPVSVPRVAVDTALVTNPGPLRFDSNARRFDTTTRRFDED